MQLIDFRQQKKKLVNLFTGNTKHLTCLESTINQGIIQNKTLF